MLRYTSPTTNTSLKGIGNTYLRGHTTAFLTDYKYFDNDTVFAAQQAQAWPKQIKYGSLQLPETVQDYHKKTQTVAYAIIQNDSLIYEQYAKDFGPTSKTNSFSMVKSMVSAMLGKAIMEGAISGLDQKAIDFLPGSKGLCQHPYRR